MSVLFSSGIASAKRNLLFALVVTISCIGAVTAATPSSVRVQVVDENGLPVRDAVVELYDSKTTASRISFPWKMSMALESQRFLPGTLIVARGSTVAFQNRDNARHSLYSFSKPARFKFDLRGGDRSRKHTFTVSGSVKLGCKIHDQMRGYIRVTETPFAGKTDHNGYITLSGMTGSSGRLTVWHPRLRVRGNEVASTLTLTGRSQNHKVKVALR